MIRPLEELCYRLCRRRLRKTGAAHTSYSTVTEYATWRDSSLERQFTTHFDASDVRGRRVVDFGCGSGDLTRFVCKLGAASATGVDLQEHLLTAARDAAAKAGVDDRVSFILGRPDAVPLASGTADVVLCFDVMEHVLAYELIIPEWRRVLTAGGRVLLWWSLWMHPYGHHCYPLVSVPWAHLVMSDAAILRVCGRLYDSPDFRPSFWGLDANGHKKPNPCVNDRTFDDYLNKLTTWKFERVVRQAGFRIARKQVIPFSGNRARALKKRLASIPYFSDAFCACVVYDLQAV
jgi:SAM-dependent methyltransferase